MPLYDYHCKECSIKYTKIMSYSSYMSQDMYCDICSRKLYKDFPTPALFKGLPTNKFYCKE